MRSLVKKIGEHFLAREDELQAFARNDTRVEGWFKGELIALLDRLRTEGLVEGFRREMSQPTGIGRKQIDFGITLDGVLHYCEIKALCISQALGTPRNLLFYFREDHVGLIKDFRKLTVIDGANKWIIGFVYPRPAIDDWQKAISTIPADLNHVSCVTRLEDYPGHLFISLWRIGLRQ